MELFIQKNIKLTVVTAIKLIELTKQFYINNVPFINPNLIKISKRTLTDFVEFFKYRFDLMCNYKLDDN
jgi:hypothetical protein